MEEKQYYLFQENNLCSSINDTLWPKDGGTFIQTVDVQTWICLSLETDHNGYTTTTPDFQAEKSYIIIILHDIVQYFLTEK